MRDRSTTKPNRGTGTRTRLLGAAVALAILAFPATAQAKVSSDFFGIFAEAPSAQDYQDMGNAGFGTYRAPVNWRSVQATRDGGYDWTQPDLVVSEAARRGLRPTVVVFGTPEFIKGSVEKGLTPPTSKPDLREWRDFTEALAARYSPEGDFFDTRPELDRLPVKKWILWNEQNAKSNWLPKADPREYAKLVENADRGISKVDRKASLVLGGMYGYPRDPKSLKAARFLSKLYRVKGIEKHFDAVNSHPYGSGVAAVKAQIGDLRSVLKKERDSGAGLVVGEVGWASSGPSRSESVVGKKGQATRLRDGLELLVRKRGAWNVEAAFVYVWRDFAAGELACLWCPGAGLVTQGGKPKPALKAVKKVIRRKG